MIINMTGWSTWSGIQKCRLKQCDNFSSSSVWQVRKVIHNSEDMEKRNLAHVTGVSIGKVTKFLED